MLQSIFRVHSGKAHARDLCVLHEEATSRPDLLSLLMTKNAIVVLRLLPSSIVTSTIQHALFRNNTTVRSNFPNSFRIPDDFLPG